jgi:hypothetical protein
MHCILNNTGFAEVVMFFRTMNQVNHNSDQESPSFQVSADRNQSVNSETQRMSRGGNPAVVLAVGKSVPEEASHGKWKKENPRQASHPYLVAKHDRQMKKQQKIIKRMKKQIRHLHAEQRLNAEPSLSETLPQKILKRLQYHASKNEAFMDESEKAIDIASIVDDFSQTILLKKINTYLKSQGRALISEDGYCHGITLLWLTMMSWNLESLFYKFVDEIVNCPDAYLNMLHENITTFLEYIDFGQHPLTNTKNMCGQQDIDKIIGVKRLSPQVSHCLADTDLLGEIAKLREKENMESITGWRMVEKVDPDTSNNTMVEEGHTVGVVYKDSAYRVYDSNYKNGKHTTFAFANEAVAEVRHRLFTLFGVTEDKPKYTVNLVSQQHTLTPRMA